MNPYNVHIHNTKLSKFSDIYILIRYQETQIVPLLFKAITLAAPSLYATPKSNKEMWYPKHTTTYRFICNVYSTIKQTTMYSHSYSYIVINIYISNFWIWITILLRTKVIISYIEILQPYHNRLIHAQGLYKNQTNDNTYSYTIINIYI